MPKVNNFVNDIHERSIGVALLSEVWEQATNKKHIFEIDKMLHMEGLKYISTLRPAGKRGGGAAIVAPVDKFSLEKNSHPQPSQFRGSMGSDEACD